MITQTTDISTNSNNVYFNPEKSDAKTLSELDSTIVTAFEDFLKTVQLNTPAKFSYDLPSSKKSYIVIELGVRNTEKLEVENAEDCPIDGFPIGPDTIGFPIATTDDLSYDTIHKINYAVFIQDILGSFNFSEKDSFEINEKNTNEYGAYVNELNESKKTFLQNELIGSYQLTDIVDPENIVSQELKDQISSMIRNKTEELEAQVPELKKDLLKFNPQDSFNILYPMSDYDFLCNFMHSLELLFLEDLAEPDTTSTVKAEASNAEAIAV